MINAPIAGGKRSCGLPGHRAGRPGGEDLDIAALPVQTGAAHSPPVGCSPRPRCGRTARSRGSPPPVKGCPWCRVNWWVGSPRVSACRARCRTSPAWPAHAAAAATLHTLGRAAGVDHRRGAGRYPAAAADVLVGGDILQSGAGIWGRGVVVTRPVGHPHRRDRAFRWTPSPTKSGAAESISTSSRPQAPTISGRWRGCRCVRSSRPAGTLRWTRRCTARQV